MRDILGIKAAVFDLDGTLFDSTAAWKGLGERYLTSRGITPAPGLDEKLRCMALPDGSEYLKARYSLPDSPAQIQADIIRGIERFYLSECRLRPGAFGLVRLLHSRGIGISAATAGDKRLACAALDRLGILGCFEDVFTCDRYGSKHEPGIFLAAARAAGGNSADTAVFEDSLHCILTAKNAGFLTAAVADPGEPEQSALKAAADYYRLSMEDYFRIFQSAS